TTSVRATGTCTTGRAACCAAASAKATGSRAAIGIATTGTITAIAAPGIATRTAAATGIDTFAGIGLAAIGVAILLEGTSVFDRRAGQRIIVFQVSDLVLQERHVVAGAIQGPVKDVVEGDVIAGIVMNLAVAIDEQVTDR